jgi:hypothetical protein
MAAPSLQSTVEENQTNIALVVGNGINRYRQREGGTDWDALLLVLAREYLGTQTEIPLGISQTEFYDLIALRADPGLRDKASSVPAARALQKRFCDLMAGWEPRTHHRQIIRWARERRVPVLTTNFEKTLCAAGDCRKLATTTEHFSDYYPWETYYGTEELEHPEEGFGIWHINGVSDYFRSVRLGLSHYMGSVQRARTWIHGAGGRRLFAATESLEHWRGRASWLHIAFTKPLAIFGLALDINEVFLRWLLIERARYFRAFPRRSKKAWYFHVNDETPGKLFFLAGVGVTPVQVKTYDELYGEPVWPQ